MREIEFEIELVLVDDFFFTERKEKNIMMKLDREAGSPIDNRPFPW